MRLLLGLALLCLAESFHEQNYGQELWKGMEGRDIVYDYKDFVYSGFPIMDDQYSVLKIEAKLHVYPETQNRLVLQMTQIQLGKASCVDIPNLMEEDIQVTPFRSQEFEEMLSKPFRFSTEQGKVENYEMDRSDKIWSMNIKRAIIEKFQVRLSYVSHEIPTNGGVIPTPSYLHTFKLEEDGIGGVCNNYYVLQSEKDFFYPHTSSKVLNITKTRDFRDCKYRPAFEHSNFDHLGCPSACKNQQFMPPHRTGHFDQDFKRSCPCGLESDETPIQSYAVTKYNISSDHNAIDSIINDGKTSLYVKGNVIVVYTRTNLTLLEIRSGRAPSVRNTVHYRELSYVPDPEIYFSYPSLTPSQHQRFFVSPVRPQDYQDAINVCLKLLLRIAENIVTGTTESGKTVGEDVLKLIKTMSTLDTQSLEQLRRKIVGSSRGASPPEKKIIMRQVFLDCLPLCGTNDAAQYIMTLPKQQLVEEYEAKSMIEAIPKNLVFPSLGTIQKLKELCLTDREIRRNVTLFSSTCVAFGKLVNVACVEPYRQSSEEHKVFSKILPEHMKIDLCTIEHVKQFTREVEERLVNAREYYEKTTYIEVIAHIAHQSGLRVLEPYVSGKAGNCRQDPEEQTTDAVCNMLRTITVYSLHHLVAFYPTEVRDLVLPIYFSVIEPYELRTACFSVMLYSDPPMPVLERVATESWTETNNHVGSFVYSALNEIANKSHPCHKVVVEKVRTVVPKMKQFELGYLYSKFLLHDFYDEQSLFGMESFLSYTSSNVSMFPRSVYLALFHNWASYFNMPLEIGANVKGMEDLLSRVNELFTSGENSWEQKSEKISYKDRKPENFKATVFLKWFERTSYYSLDRKTAVEALQRLVESLKHMSAEPYHYTKVLMPNSIFKLVPSEIGLPVVVASMNPLVLSLKLDKFNINTNANTKTTKNIETTISPAVYLTSVLTSTLVSPPDQMCYGSSVIRTDNFAIPIRMSASTVYHSNNPSLKLKVNPVSSLPYEVVHHKTIAGTFAHKCWLLHSDSSIYEDLKPIQSLPQLSEFNVTLSSKILGRGVSFQGVTDNVWGRIPFWNQPIAKRLGIVPAFLEVVGNPEWVYRDFQLLVIQDPNSRAPLNEYDFNLSYKRERVQDSSSGKPEQWFGHKESLSSSSESIESTENHFDLNGMMENIYGRHTQLPKSTRQSPQWMIIPDGTKSIFPGGFRHTITGSILSNRSPYLPLEMVLKYYPTFNYRDHSIDLNISLRSIEDDSRQWKLVASSEIQYPKIPSDFQYASPARGDQATWKAQASWGKSGTSRQSEIKIQGTLDEISGLSTDARGWGGQSEGSPWYEEQCKRDTSEGKTRSYACKVAIEQNNVFRRFSVDIHYSQISPKLMNFTRALDLLAKTHFYANMDRNVLPSVSRLSDDELRVVLKFPLVNSELSLMDASLFKPSEKVLYELLYLPFVLPASSFLKYYEVYENYLLNYRYLTECSIMENYMTTFDNVTIPFPKDNCEYVISRDCSHSQLYTVYTKQVRENKVITIEAAEHKIIILSVKSPRSAQISVDGTIRQLSTDSPIYITTKKDYISIYLLDTPNNLPSTVVVEIPEVGILVKSDCKRALVKINPYYWGRHCGACGDFNGEGYLDYLGPEQCIYKLSEDNVFKYAVRDSGCQVPPNGPRVCPASNQPFPGTPRESSSCKLLHTMYIYHGNQVCFGHDPVIKCMGSCRPTNKNVKTTMKFHCVDKDDYFTKQLMHMADIMALPNMDSLPPADLVQTFATISDCKPDHL